MVITTAALEPETVKLQNGNIINNIVKVNV